MGKAIGIDLGTTNSCCAVYEGGEEAKVILSNEGQNTTPSVVAFVDYSGLPFTSNGVPLVGTPAKRQAITNAKNTVSSIKRIMGLMIHEKKAKEAIEKVGYKIVSTNGACTVEIDGEVKSPQEISAEILKKIKRDAETFLDEEVNEAVITVPAYFNNAQRKATREACEIAGLKVLRILNEPTAAALAYGIAKKDKLETILVFDLGGGTLDISILEIDNGYFEVLSTDGDAFLGGDDFDNIIINHLNKNFKNLNGIDLSTDVMAWERLKDSAQKAKEELSFVKRCEIDLPFITADATGPYHLREVLSKNEFESMTKYLVDKAIKHIKQVLDTAGLKIDDIDEVLMVGGSSRIPSVNIAVENFFNGKKLQKGFNTDEIVAKGAAILGATLSTSISHQSEKVVLVDITPLSLGIALIGDEMSILIPKGTSLPTSIKRVYTNGKDNEKKLSLHIYQGELGTASKNKLLGKFILNIPEMKAGKARIEVEFNLDVNGILDVQAIETTTNSVSKMIILDSSDLSYREINKLKSK